jgi:hypothetical protein
MKAFARISIVAFSTMFSAQIFAGPTCTTEAKDKWQDQKKFEQNLINEGYKIKKFKVTKTSCYEIYGTDKDGKKVEIYFNPVTGEKVKEE